MLTVHIPTTWQELQNQAGRILSECGFTVEIEKLIDTVRGKVTIDVYAEETVRGRLYKLLCECKRWKAPVPQTVIHSFRTVVGDSGANVGYIISSGGFQSGAFSAAELSNIELVTWEGFQDKFQESWLENYLLPFVADHFDPLLTYTEPLLPRAFSSLPDDRKRQFIALKDRYDPFGWLMMMFTPYTKMLRKEGFPKLPLRAHFKEGSTPEKEIPAAVLDALGYRDFLDAAVEYGDKATSEFREIIQLN